MFSLSDKTLILAATDVTNHLACPHLTQQRLAIARKERSKPRQFSDPHADITRERGEKHERDQLEKLTAEAGGCVDLTAEPAYTRDGLEAAAERTADAMRAGAPLIYQAQLFDGRWQGRADFLRRIDVPSVLGDFAYEVLDTKLARGPKPQVVHQLALYSGLLAKVQGAEPAYAHVILGDGKEVPIDLRRYSALHRHTVRQLEAIIDAPTLQTYPDPVAHCSFCALAGECNQRWRDDDHLSLVARIRRDQREDMVEASIETVAMLALTDAEPASLRLGEDRFDLLHHQAALQVDSRDSGQPNHRHLEPERAAGYAALPPASPADIFFDLEGDPYIGDGGIEYLWGWWTEGGGYQCRWAHTQPNEKAAFEQFVDVVVTARVENPDLHVYHYAPHEKSKLRSLSIGYATREVEVDQLLRDEVLVDLFAVVRHGFQVGEESYSLKALERHHGFVRHETKVREGGGSIVAYESWLSSGEDDLLETIRAYNEEDCRSTYELRNWIAGPMTTEAAAQFDVDFEELRNPDPEEPHKPPEWLPDVEDLIARLTDGLSEDPESDSVDEAERRLLSHLVLYHYRESKPQWWRYFDLLATPLDDLLDDRDALVRLELDPEVQPAAYKRSFDHAFRFAPQEFRLKRGGVVDPTTERDYKLVDYDNNHIWLRWGASSNPPPPVALIGSRPIDIASLRNALIDLAESVLAREDTFPAARALLRRETPRVPGANLGNGVEELKAATLALDRSILPVQGPPGTGKTYRGARMIVAALREKKRVGVSGFSHAAIKNLLTEVEAVAHDEGVDFKGVYKGERYDSQYGLIETVDDNEAVDETFQLAAGTAWLFARPEQRDKFDLLFVDEAGQQSLAATAASAISAKSVVLLGDPQQLPQVTQAEHPDGSGASVLEHLLAGEQTIPADRGVLLTESWRMHPDVCAFVSERSYDSRLHSRGACSLRRVDASVGALTGAGLRRLSVAHQGRSQASPEEANAIGIACQELLAGTMVYDDEGGSRDLAESDILVVAPYNLAVHEIEGSVPAGVRVGTVDRFQGQEAPLVFYAMTCSSGEDVPRGLDFLFDDHRLNVAISRAQCLAVLVHSPRLLDVECRSLEQMELVDGVCRFVEMVEAGGTTSASSD